MTTAKKPSTKSGKKVVRRAVEKYNRTESSILKSLKEAVRWAAGEDVPGVRVVPVPATNVKAIRERMGLSQTAFARRFCFSPSTLRNWEQGVRQPEATARVLLTLIDHEPKMVMRVLKERGIIPPGAI